MEPFFGSIANIIGESFNKLINIIFGKKKKEEKNKKAHKVFVPPDPNIKPAPWTRKR